MSEYSPKRRVLPARLRRSPYTPLRYVFEMHDPTRGDNSKVMEITYTRR